MPAVSFDSTTAPKRPRLVHVSIAANAKVSEEQADLVRVLLDPKATRPGKGKGAGLVRLGWPSDAPERVPDDATKAKGVAPVEVVIVCSLCATPPGRMIVLKALRAAGVPADATSRLGWATSVPKDGLELSPDGTKAKGKLGEPVKKSRAKSKSKPKQKSEPKSDAKPAESADPPKPDEKK